jgi:hypothetical protein
MKFKLLSLSLFSISAVSPFFLPALTPSAMAGCVAVDTSVQVSIDNQERGRQSNRTKQEFGPNCENSVGSSVRSSATQVCNSSSCVQRRTSDQYVDGGRYVPVKTNNIGVQVHIPVHVKKPNIPGR